MSENNKTNLITNLNNSQMYAMDEVENQQQVIHKNQNQLQAQNQNQLQAQNQNQLQALNKNQNKEQVSKKPKNSQIKDKQSNGPRHIDYQSMSREELILSLKNADIMTSRLKNKLAEHEPFKQRALRNANEQKLIKLFEKYQTQKFAFKVCYLGFNYDGMACQSTNDNTVEEYIFKALYTMSLISTPLPEIDYTRAGRTDKGVSAMGNVIALPLRTNRIKIAQTQQQQPTQQQQRQPTTQQQQPKQQRQPTTHPLQLHQKQQVEPYKSKIVEPINYCKMLNSILPEDIRMLACEPVKSDFNARYWCSNRCYKYFFAKNNLNIELMKVAIKQFEGTHNFINYCKMNVTNTVNFERTIKSAEIIFVDRNELIQVEDDRNSIYYFYFIGNSFLWHQIRFMSSILFMVGLGKESPNIVQQLFDLKKYPTKPNYAMAPEYPLILEDCQYQQITFHPQLQIIQEFYNTFNHMVLKKSVEKVLIINCMLMARKDLTTSINITQDVFRKYVIEKNQLHNKGCKTIQMHKSSSRGLEEAIKNLKGKKLELYLKKAEKQANYEQRIRKEEEQKKKSEEMLEDEPMPEDLDE